MATLPDWVERYIGIPYVEAGRDPVADGGLDCWGLLVLIWREQYGVDLPAYDGPHWAKGANRAAIAAAIRAEQERYTDVAAGAEREGDGILLRLLGQPLHVGLVVAPGWMIHTHETAAVCIESYRGMAWARRVMGFRRPV
jgi:cell wall-associated NlpC family hydrolase